MYKKLVEMSKNDDYATGNLLDYLYHQNIYKNALVLNYQDKKMQVFLIKLILQEN